MVDVVLDASAVLAVLNGEPGAEAVWEHLPGAQLSAVNAAEVAAKLVDGGLGTERAGQSLDRLGTRVVPFEAAERAVADESAEPFEPAPNWVWTIIRKGGVIQLTAEFLEAMGVAEGDQVQLALDGDIVRVLSRAAAIRELQNQVRRHVPEGVSLVDELIAERRAEATREARNATDG